MKQFATVTIITLVYKTLYYACYRVCDVTCTTAGGNTQPRWQPTTASDAVVTATVTDLVLCVVQVRYGLG